MRYWSRLALFLVSIGASLPAAWAAEVKIWGREVTVESTAPGVALTITDFWDKPVESAFGRVKQGRWTYMVKHGSLFSVQARDLTEDELRALEQDERLRRIEQEIEALRNQRLPDPTPPWGRGWGPR